MQDTAKLALSIHTERQNSSYLSSHDGNLPTHVGNFANQKPEGLSPEELVLESRLMVQLRGALGQLHEIFFSWPMTNKLELLAISRSLPQRTRRVPSRISGTRDEPQHAESYNDVWAQRDSIDVRRRWNSGVSHSNPRSPTTGENRITEYVTNVRSYANYSLTKSIDSVRQSWPQNQLERRQQVLFPLSGLTALAYDNAEHQQTKQQPQPPQPPESCEAIASPVLDQHHSEPYLKGNKIAKLRTQIPKQIPRSSKTRENDSRSSDRVSSADTQLDYTPVRLHTPPTPNTLKTMISNLTNLSTKPIPTAALRPPVGRASCFTLRQMCQNLRTERQKSGQIPFASSINLSIKSNQNRPIQLHRRGALLVHQFSGSNQLSTGYMLLDAAQTRMSKTEGLTNVISTPNSLIAKSQTYSVHRHSGRRKKRCLSSVNLADHPLRERPWQTHRSISALAEYPARVPYWKEVLWQWRNQRHNPAGIAGDLPVPIHHNTDTLKDLTVKT
ncbi:unnamed protein product [Echinostoma caproni]|uniref:Uncharacterized protein n=1 Tax=Echinostoma caproni TaxID=27848 RepID=A0A3P8KIG8_9TREM|nr:unnamed protein product [Echinostoma caproni]